MPKSKLHRLPTVLLVLVVASCTGKIDPPPVGWMKTFGNGSKSYFWSVRETRDGGFILAGAINSEDGHQYDYYVVKTNSEGKELWARTLGGDLYEWATSVEETRDGGFIIAGNSGLYAKEPADCCLIRLASDGGHLWTRTYGGRRSEVVWAVLETPDGGFILGGWTNSSGAGETDVYLVKTDPFGEPLWQRTFGGESYDGFPFGGLRMMADGGFIIATSTTSASLGARKQDVYLIRTGPNGEKIWEVTIGGAESESGTCVEVLADGGFVVGGHKDDRIYLARTTPSGKLIWNETYGRAVDDEPVSVRVLNGREIIAVARTLHATADRCSDVYLIRIDLDGRLIWETTLGGNGYDSGYSLETLRGGGFAVAGSSDERALLAEFGPEKL